MVGVDIQARCASLLRQRIRAARGLSVDFVEGDDLSRPMMRMLRRSRRLRKPLRGPVPMMLSMSPGEAPLVRGAHARAHAQMWRISDDFWDDWGMLAAQFTRLENWNLFVGQGCWPDADMLPLGD